MDSFHAPKKAKSVDVDDELDPCAGSCCLTLIQTDLFDVELIRGSELLALGRNGELMTATLRAMVTRMFSLIL